MCKSQEPRDRWLKCLLMNWEAEGTSLMCPWEFSAWRIVGTFICRCAFIFPATISISGSRTQCDAVAGQPNAVFVVFYLKRKKNQYWKFWVETIRQHTFLCKRLHFCHCRVVNGHRNRMQSKCPVWPISAGFNHLAGSFAVASSDMPHRISILQLLFLWLITTRVHAHLDDLC